MPSYEIKRWDPVIPKENILPYPMITITPDKNFVDYAKANNYLVMVTIHNSGLYDGKQIIASIDSSGYFPSYRPNYYNDTGNFTLTLFSNWNGYPPFLGNVMVQGFSGPDNLKPAPPFVPPVPKAIEWFDTSSNITSLDPAAGLKSNYIIMIFVAVLIVFLILFLVYNRK